MPLTARAARSRNNCGAGKVLAVFKNSFVVQMNLPMHQRSAPRAGSTLIEMTAVILIIATQDKRHRMVQQLRPAALSIPGGNEYLVSVDCDYDSYTQSFISYTDLTYTPVTGGSSTWPAVNVSCFARATEKTASTVITATTSITIPMTSSPGNEATTILRRRRSFD